ncbi:MAG: pyridoxamine 5'-phosphate oxidase family protein [Actinomycetota bacterium]
MISKNPIVRQRLTDEPIAWLTTVSSAGKPSTAPVWFYLEDDDTLTIYSKDPSVRVRNLDGNGQVTLHLEGDGEGGAIVVLNGTAVIDKSISPVTSHPAFVAKYQRFLDRFGWSPDDFTRGYPTPIRVTIAAIRA